MKFRHVFTVTRELEEDSEYAAKIDFLGVQDEKGEYLYGGYPGPKETIAVTLEMWNGTEWVVLAT